MIRTIQTKDKERWKKLYIGYADFYKVEMNEKIVQTVCEIYHGKKNNIYLGDISAEIDWGYAKEYVENAWKIMQLKKPDFFIIATGEKYSVWEFVKETFGILELDPEKYVVSDKKFFRPTTNVALVGDSTKARKAFGFDPKIKFKRLVRLMVESDLKQLRNSY